MTEKGKESVGNVKFDLRFSKGLIYFIFLIILQLSLGIEIYFVSGLNITISGWGKKSYDQDLKGRNFVSKLQYAT